jgi:4-amino-4-deoxy-L-arabinose transferase-like glycosyltransferase
MSRMTVLSSSSGKNKADNTSGTLRATILVFLLALLFFTIRLGATSLWDSDEPLYTEIAREMTRTGDWITPRWNGDNWFCHPPLYFWLTALTGMLLGWTEFSARFWSAFFGAATVALIYMFGAKARDSKLGAASAAILATSLHMFGMSRIALLDTCLVFFLTLALYCFILGYTRKDGRFFYGFWLSCALATLAKGPFGFFFPTGIAFLFLLWRRDLPFLGKMKLIPGLAIYLAIAAPWYIAGVVLHGRDFFDKVFTFYVYKRVVSPILNQGGPWYYYVPILAAGFLPWVAFLPQTLTHLRRRCDEPIPLLLLMWIVPSFIFFSLAGTKLPNYILIMYPAMSLGTAFLMLRDPGHENREGDDLVPALLFLVIITCAVCIYIAIFGMRSYPSEYMRLGGMQYLVAGILLAGYIAALASALRDRAFVLPALAATNIAVFLLILSALPKTESFKPVKPLALEVRNQLTDEDMLAVVSGVDGNNSFVFYTGRPVKVLNTVDEQVAFLSSDAPHYVMMSGDQLRALQKKVRKPLRVFSRVGNHYIITNRR